MTTQQNDTAALTDEQLDAVAGGTPHYTDFTGRFQFIGGTMCSARASPVKERGVISRVAMPDWARYRPIGIPPEPQ